MMILIGEEGSKRTDYMKKAAASLDTGLEVIGWDALLKGIDLRLFEGAAVKIDPPSFQTAHLLDMQKHLEEYRDVLQRLAQAECRFLNPPGSIWQLLDKRETKLLMQGRGIPVTQMFSEDIRTAEQLLERMERKHCYSVFVKPRYFSGAAGVAAFRIHPVSGKMRLYTSCRTEGKQLVNTKKLFALNDRREILPLLNQLLLLDCVVERWHPKADFQKKSFDLRIVFQFGHVAHVVVRQSKGPITNLHLNNQALDLQALGLEEKIWKEIVGVCEQAVSFFPNLSMAGIDILLERETLRPLIIEMNGQGDLIYQDIYGENRIYREQVRELCRA